MPVNLGAKISEVPGHDVAIRCLWCGRQGVNARTRQRTEWLTLFYLIPLLRFRTVFVQCGNCGQDMIANCSFAEMARSNSTPSSLRLVKSVSFVGKVCILLGALLCWAPMIGLIPAGIGFLYRKQYGGWMMTLSWFALILSLLSTLFGLAAFVIAK